MSLPWLGSFRLDEPLAAGAMGAVWSATHRRGARAAVKVIGGAAGQHRGFRRAFLREVRATAGLTHPNVVTVYDVGELPDAVASATDGALVAGSPYMVMAYVPDTLESVRLVDAKSFVRVMRDILLGLAHAHARGVVHRDLKPANVLFGDGRFQLADFGVAHPLDARTEGMWGGTLAYMAPEQLDRDFRSYGPWTDLFALGCVGWELATGRRLYEASDLEEARRAQAGLRSAPFLPRLEVPEGTEDWLRTLLALAPEERFLRAAHALDALPGGGARGEAVPSGVCRVPMAWGGGATEEAPDGPVGVGLVGLRPVPLVGRMAARDLLWSDLVAAARGDVQLRLLHGPDGVGLSRLASWLSERGAEVGVPTVLTARFAAREGRASPLVSMVERWWQLRGADRGEVEARLHARLPQPAGMAERLLELIRSDGSAPTTWKPATTSFTDWQVETVGQWMAHRARLGPVLCVLDDLPFGPEGEALAHWLQGHAQGVVVVATAQDASTEGRALTARWRGAQLAVAPLSEEEGEALVQRLLPMERALGGELLARAGGCPGFVVQLVESWAQQGLLELGAEGYTMRPGAVPPLPDGIRALWRERLLVALADRPPADRHALEVAAYLGSEIDPAEWAAACARLGLRPWRQLLFELELRGLLLRTEGGGHRFAHPLLAETLVEACDASGSGERVRGELVAMLREEGAELAGLGPAAVALRPLERALALVSDEVTRLDLRRRRADEWRRTGRPEEGLAELEAVCAEAQSGGYAEVEAAAWRRLAVAADQLGDRALAEARFEAALAAHRRAPVAEDVALTLYQLAWTLAYHSEPAQARQRLDEAVSIVPPDAWSTRFQVRSLRATVCMTLGDDAGARGDLAGLGELLEHLGPREAMAAQSVVFNMHTLAGRRASARRSLCQSVATRAEHAGLVPSDDVVRDVQRLAERVGTRRVVAVLLRHVALSESDLGRSSVALQLLDQASEVHDAAADLQSAIGTDYSRLRVLLERGDLGAFWRARQALGRAALEHRQGARWLVVYDALARELEGRGEEAIEALCALACDPEVASSTELALAAQRTACRLWRTQGRGPLPAALVRATRGVTCADVPAMERDGWLGEACGQLVVQSVDERIAELGQHDQIAWWARRARALAGEGAVVEAREACRQAEALRAGADWPHPTLAEARVTSAWQAARAAASQVGS